MKTKTYRFLPLGLTVLVASASHIPSSNHYEGSPVSANAEAAMVNFEQDALISAGDVSEWVAMERDAELAASSGTGGTGGASGAGGAGGGIAGDAGSSSAESVNSLGVEVGGGTFSTDDIDGKFYTVRIPYSKKVNERGTLLFTVPLSLTNFDNNKLNASFTKFKDTQAYGVGLNVGYAWQAFLKRHKVPYRWKITPSAGVYYRDSNDLDNGQLVFNAGLSSSFAWQFKPGWVINLGNSVSMAWNNGISDYPDPVLHDQQTVSNGLQLIRMSGRWTWFSYYSHTDALVDTLVDSYYTIAVGAGYQLTRKRSLKATLYSEQGNGDFEAVRATLGSSWQF
ncbi:MAG: hypothetical protein RIQ79_871 [Verrucomicrobiota bacterium]